MSRGRVPVAGVAGGVAGQVTKPHLQLVESAAVTGWKTVAPGIQATPTGKYRVRLRVSRKRVTLGVFASLQEALSMQAAADENVATLASKRPSLASWLPTYLDHRAAGDVRSVRSERDRARKHILSSKIARIPLPDLRRADVLAWLRELEAKSVDLEGQRVGWARRSKKTKATEPRHRRANAATRRLSRQTRVHCLKLLRGALDAAVEEEILAENPAIGIKIKKETRTEDESTVLAPAEQERLLAVVPEPERWVVAVAIGAGLRQGEQFNLELADVHLDADIPYVDIRFGAKGRKPTKGGRPRQVPLVGPALPAMRSWIGNLGGWCARVNALAFPTKRGNNRGKKPPRGWTGWLRKAGITRRVRWHDLRHTCASALVSGQWGRRWSLEEVKEFLGHASIRTTERYARFAKDALMDAARETNGVTDKRPK